ncbi:Putative serine protease HtrA [Corynebacterium atrinae]|uniref:YlbL family protein n=1 Tax=Corynebacterium atrinae TaxID=1336740 RepID=UPI0025B621FC|nr:PDZ domain-containing protein [Corynebacterium atrinae]WJY62733.1 Putative serine protease HtrA [Corynebacterium atrinae]
MNRPRRRLHTLAWGSIPVLALLALVSLDHVPGTQISLTVPYAAEGPGPIFDTLGDVDGVPVVEIDGSGEPVDPTSGQLQMTTVSVRTNMTLAQAMGRWLTTDDTLVPIEQIFPPDLTQEEVEQSNKQAFSSSEASATVAAMNHLGRPVQVVVADTVENSAAVGVLDSGDIITGVDGQTVDQPGQVQDKVRAKKPGDSVDLELLRDGQPEAVTVTLGETPQDPSVPMLGILMNSEPTDGIDVSYNLQDVGGPSAGMIFSLAVIDKLSPGELNGGRNVAGTGTISEDGTVGPIGGIVHKVRAAQEDGAELFLAPAANCSEATSRDHGDMVIAKVSTLDEAITAMTDFAAGRDVATCS